MNTSVSPTSKIDSANSFGVFCLRADSTIEIMRSRNDSPGLTVTCTTSQSDSTRVPPVTEEKSPPASRITGADSPVMALSSTEATPSITVPSSAMVSPASTSITTPARNSLACTGTHWAPKRGSVSTLATVLRFMPRRLAAWARLRPSASASAKLANNTVNHSQSAIARMNPAGASPSPPKACAHSSVVKIAPRYTTNMTGLRHCARGVSLRTESIKAPRTRLASNNGSEDVFLDM